MNYEERAAVIKAKMEECVLRVKDVGCWVDPRGAWTHRAEGRIKEDGTDKLIGSISVHMQERYTKRSSYETGNVEISFTPEYDHSLSYKGSRMLHVDNLIEKIKLVQRHRMKKLQTAEYWQLIKDKKDRYFTDILKKVENAMHLYLLSAEEQVDVTMSWDGLMIVSFYKIKPAEYEGYSPTRHDRTVYKFFLNETDLVVREVQLGHGTNNKIEDVAGVLAMAANYRVHLIDTFKAYKGGA